MKLSEELVARGFVHQHTGESLGDIIDAGNRTVYLGVDPTADSIHAGNFVIYMLLRHLAKAGHKIIMLAGGGTGMIGDPKPDVERPLLSKEEIDARVVKLQTQAAALIAVPQLMVVNNFDWLGELKLIEFLRDIGKNFTVNELIKKDAIATRLQSDTGLSYTEFAYPLLQGYDYLELYRQYGCDLQVGGSDQWGNIVAGVDLVRRKEQKEVHALTVPLVIDKATGKKFGKSEGNAVWLDPEKTSPYQFYQFWLNVADDNVFDYLKLFTFLSLTEIADIEQQFRADPGARLAQRTLAFEVTKLVHTEAVAKQVQNVSELLFGQGQLADLSEDELSLLIQNAPVCEVTEGQSIVDILVACNLATSKREARTFIEGGAIELAGVRISESETILSESMFVHNSAILKRGKKQLCVLVKK